MIYSSESKQADVTAIDDGRVLAVPPDTVGRPESPRGPQLVSHEMQLYEECLVEAGVNLLRQSSGAVVSSAVSGNSWELPPATEEFMWKSALELMAERPGSTRIEEIIKGCMAQSMLVAETMQDERARPIGFDARFDRFAVASTLTTATVFVKSNYPPRLMFTVSESGEIKRTQIQEYFVDGPEELEIGKKGREFLEPLLRIMYYTADGIAVNVLAWSIAAYYAAAKDREKFTAVMTLDSTHDMINICLDSLSPQLAHSLVQALKDVRVGHYINFRMSQAWRIYKELSEPSGGFE